MGIKWSIVDAREALSLNHSVLIPVESSKIQSGCEHVVDVEFYGIRWDGTLEQMGRIFRSSDGSEYRAAYRNAAISRRIAIKVN